MIKAILCDLDETLFDEWSYVECGLKAVASHLSQRFSADASELLGVMRSDIRRNGRGTAFNAALRYLAQPDHPIVVSELVAVYRGHQPVITLSSDAEHFLTELRAIYPDVRRALVTDGLPEMQRAKVVALSLDQLFNEVVYCWEENAAKPSPKAFLLAAERLGVQPSQCAMIGDRVDHDLQPAKSLGMHTIRIARGRYATQTSNPSIVDVTFHDFTQVLQHLLPRIAAS